MAHGCGYEDTINKQEASPLKGLLGMSNKTQEKISPLRATDPRIKKLRKTKRTARKLNREENKEGRDAVKKFNAGQDEYMNASEFKAFKAEGKGIKKSSIKDANEEIKKIRKNKKN